MLFLTGKDLASGKRTCSRQTGDKWSQSKKFVESMRSLVKDGVTLYILIIKKASNKTREEKDIHILSVTVYIVYTSSMA